MSDSPTQMLIRNMSLPTDTVILIKQHFESTNYKKRATGPKGTKTIKVMMEFLNVFIFL